MAQNTLFGETVETEDDLFKRFLVPPFSVLDSRQGYWQERKKKWISLGIESEVGRDAKAFHIHDWIEKHRDTDDLSGSVHGGGTSIFDPVIAELMYLWFTKEGHTILDPFAGGSVRGIVANKLNRVYKGIDLRQEQVDANKKQGLKVCGKDDLWICGDSRNIQELIKDKVDFIFSCPPYGNLEVYSDNPQDLSTLEYHDFILSYAEIIAKAFDKLKDNRFACFVVGDIRNKKNGGSYYNFISDTISCFQSNKLILYNNFTLINSVGSMCLRINKQFVASRKNGNVHQNVLVFIKGDPKKATEELGIVKLINPFK